jgi:probable phosphoglycerate mutase
VSSRRSLTNYIDDINKEHISYRKYVFNDNKVSVKKFQFEMNDKMRMEYNFHVVKFILLNMMKIINQENLDYSELEIIKNFSLEGYEKRKIINILNKLYLWKYHKSDNPKNLLKPIKKELFDLNDKYLKFVENLPLINFIRHKKTKYNDGSFLGIGRDPDIMDNMKFDDEKYNLIFSSEMKRAFSTAKLLNCKKILINDLLNEIDYGKAEGMTYVDLKISYPEIIEQWNLKNDPKFPNGENSRDVIFRLEKFLEKNIYSINLKKVAVVTHNVVVRMLLSKFYQIDLNLSCKLTIDNCEKIPFRVYGNNIIPQLNHDQRIKFRDQFTYE